MLRWLHRNGGVPDGANDPGSYDPRFVAQVLRFAGRFFGPGRYFDLDARGLEHVPPKPVMVVLRYFGRIPGELDHVVQHHPLLPAYRRGRVVNS